MAAAAPDEIADANDVLVERMRTAHEHHEAHDWDENSPRMDLRIEQDIEEANTELTAYADSNC